VFEGIQSNSQWGHAVANAGDVDADGYDDVIVGEPYYDRIVFPADLIPNAGRARVFSGRTGEVLYSFLGSHASEELGFSVAGGGDVDGDAHADVAVGRPGALDSISGTEHSGGVSVFRGVDGSTILSYSVGLGTAIGSRYGHAIAFANLRDGPQHPFDEIVVGMPFSPGTGSMPFPPEAGGVDVRNVATFTAFTVIPGTQDFEHAGWCVANAGDWTGDGLDELAFGAPGYDNLILPDSGRVAVYSYATSPATLVVATTGGLASNVEYGWSLDGMGDWNGDGWPELVVGAPGADGDTGRAQVVLGPAGGAGPVFHGTQAGARYGAAVAGAGDVDGNGTPEIVVGAPMMDVGAFPVILVDVGYAEVRSPGSSSPDPYLTWSAGLQSGALSGFAVGGGGDVNGDGLADVVLGAPFADTPGGDDRGLAVVRTWSDLQAWHSPFGTGLAGTLGVPSLDVDAEPVLGETFGVVMGNSNPSQVIGYLHVGFSQAAIPAKGGVLYTNPWQSIPLIVAAPQSVYTFGLPLDLSLMQLEVYMQVTLPDPGAPVGWSFSRGLQLVFGV
jgi:hypothetical protein